MIINGRHILAADPLDEMYETKQSGPIVTYGMSESGYDIRIKQNVILHPFRRFSIASSVECFDMPDNLMAVVHDKSSWARRGLSVFNTVIEPGWHGYLTLELVYHNWVPLRIPAGSGIAQVIFHELKEPRRYTGRYQDQPDNPVKARRIR